MSSLVGEARVRTAGGSFTLGAVSLSGAQRPGWLRAREPRCLASCVSSAADKLCGLEDPAELL